MSLMAIAMYHLQKIVKIRRNWLDIKEIANKKSITLNCERKYLFKINVSADAFSNKEVMNESIPYFGQNWVKI